MIRINLTFSEDEDAELYKKLKSLGPRYRARFLRRLFIESWEGKLQVQRSISTPTMETHHDSTLTHDMRNDIASMIEASIETG